MPYILPREAATVPTAKHGEFHLGVLTVAAFERISKIPIGLDPREYSVRVLHAVLEPPPARDLNTVRMLPDGVLKRLARVFAASPHGLDAPLPPRHPVFLSFKKAVNNCLTEQIELTRETLAGISSSIGKIMSPISQQFIANLISPLTSDLVRGLSSDMVATIGKFTAPPVTLPKVSGGATQSALAMLAKSANEMADTLKRLNVSPMTSIAQQIAKLPEGAYWGVQSQTYMSDIARLGSLKAFTAPHLAPLLIASSEMSSRLSTYIGDIQRAQPPASIGTELIVPTRTSAFALGTVKHLGIQALGVQETIEPATPPRPTGTEQLRSDIDKYLLSVDARLVDSWHGAWEVLRTPSSDRIRQAAHSGREVLAQVLHELAPDSAFTPEEMKQCKGKPSRKMRIGKILGTRAGSSKVAVVDAQARLAEEIYGAFSGVAHAHIALDDEKAVIGLLMTLDGVLFTLLASRWPTD